MLIPVQRLYDALNSEFAKIAALHADSNVDGSAAQGITNALLMLANRNAGGRDALCRHVEAVRDVLGQISSDVGASDAALSDKLRDVIGQCDETINQPSLAAMEERWAGCMAAIQAVMVAMNASATVPRQVRQAARSRLVAWEGAYLQSQGAPRDSMGADAAAQTITRDKLEAYLRDRFAEPGLTVTSFHPLAGGYGKQTILFDAAGTALDGSFVMRRDIGMRPTVANDCHSIRDEHPVVKAVFDRGFPAPDALWLDTEHRLLPGGDFMIMRRSPGTLPGNIFGARTALPENLTTALAEVMAQLHRLPQLTELGDLTESINADRWGRSKSECTELYIRSWYELYLREVHTPSPALVAIFGWLLDNVPQRGGAPSLIHGDIGFHNFLFHEGRLEVVLDWEFAHLGDPAEELGYVKMSVGSTINWDQMMAAYIAAGGEPVDEATLRYFQIWSYARNAAGGNMLYTMLSSGDIQDLKVSILPVMHIPHFIHAAEALIAEAG